MIRFAQGNLLEARTEAVVNTVNTLAGLRDVEIVLYEPTPKYQNAIKNRGLK
jgi:hypothetical protein